MEGVVAKRTLKRSYYANNNISITKDEDKKYEKVKKNKSTVSLKEKIIFKLAVQAITTIAIVTFVTLIKVMNIKIVQEAEITNKLKSEFNKRYTLNEIKHGSLQ